ncbi:hypothetical protein EK904_010747 [Melospiza melodia maxima]|nr:hypothetical protein EK904_010747 [Melospiza melodia maxima]
MDNGRATMISLQSVQEDFVPSASDASGFPPRYSGSHRSQQLVHTAPLIAEISAARWRLSMQLGAASSSSWLAAGAVAEESAPLWSLPCQQIPACWAGDQGPPRCIWPVAQGDSLPSFLWSCAHFSLLQSELSEKKI